MEQELKIDIPNSTLVRKICTILAAKKLNDTKNKFLCEQMSHQQSITDKIITRQHEDEKMLLELFI